MNKYERGTTDSSMPQDLIKIKSQEHIPKYIIPYEKSGLSVGDKGRVWLQTYQKEGMNVSKEAIT